MRAQFRDTVMLRMANGMLGLPTGSVTAAIYDVGTSSPIGDTLYADDNSSITLTNPVQVGSDGYLSFWTQAERELDIVTTYPGYGTTRTTATTDAAAGPGVQANWPLGGSIAQILSKRSGTDYDTKWVAPQAVSLEDFGGSPSNTDNSPALTAAVAALPGGGGMIFMGPGAWTFASSVQWAYGITIAGAGIATTTVNFNGTGYWITFPSNVAGNGGGFRDMTINVSAAGTGAIQMGSFANRLTGLLPLKQDWRNLYITGPGNTHAGTCGVQMYAVGESFFSNISIYNFEMGLLMQTTTVNVGTRIRILGCRYAFRYARDGATLETSGDVFYFMDLLGPFTAGASTDGYAIKSEADALQINSAYIEPSPTDHMKALIWIALGANGASAPVGNRFTNVDMGVSGATITNPIIVDAAYAAKNGFHACGLGIGPGATIGPSSVVSPYLGYNENALTWASDCDQNLSDSLAATGYVDVYGRTRIPQSTQPPILGHRLGTSQLRLGGGNYFPTGYNAMLALGSGEFGTGASDFQGVASGTWLGMNIQSGHFSMNFVDLQRAGISHFIMNGSGQMQVARQIYPGAETLVVQLSGGLLHSTGVPSNSNGNNNDWCISDNGHLYFKAAGAWVQKI